MSTVGGEDGEEVFEENGDMLGLGQEAAPHSSRDHHYIKLEVDLSLQQAVVSYRKQNLSPKDKK